MKLIALLVSIILLVGCGTKGTVTEVSSMSAEEQAQEALEQAQAEAESLIEDEVEYFIGTVYLGQDNCEISITIDGVAEKLYPVGLAEMFRVEGAKLEFSYIPSRAPLPRGCENCKVVVLDNITRIKG